MRIHTSKLKAKAVDNDRGNEDRFEASGPGGLPCSHN